MSLISRSNYLKKKKKAFDKTSMEHPNTEAEGNSYRKKAVFLLDDLFFSSNVIYL